MATWEDGPEYAPTTAPTQFVSPDVSPLEDAPERPTAPDVPQHAPGDYHYSQPGNAPSLTDLGRARDEHARNPVLPFDVHGSTLTAQSTEWETQRLAITPSLQQWAPPQGAATTGIPEAERPLHPARDPHRPFDVSHASSHTVEEEPEEHRRPTGPPTNAREAAEHVGFLLGWPLVISLLLGLIPIISPVMLAVAAILTQQIDESLARLRKVALGALLFVGGICLLSLFATSDWWGLTGRWSVLVTVLLSVYTAFVTVARMKVVPRPPDSPRPQL